MIPPYHQREEGEKWRYRHLHRMGDRKTKLSPHHGESLFQPTMPPQETVCLFCGVATHGHRDCPVLHQYIREQADALAEIRLNEYR